MGECDGDSQLQSNVQNLIVQFLIRNTLNRHAAMLVFETTSTVYVYRTIHELIVIRLIQMKVKSCLRQSCQSMELPENFTPLFVIPRAMVE